MSSDANLIRYRHLIREFVHSKCIDHYWQDYTEDPRADCTQAGRPIKGIDADHLIADEGYDTDAILEQAAAQGMNAVIPPKKSRTIQRPYDEDLYKLRHLIENAFLILKRWRGIATRYAKNSKSFLAAVQIRCIALWLKIS